MSETTVSKSQMLTVLRDDHRLLREAFEEERQQNAALKNWIKDQLRPGIRTLKDSLYQRVAELEAELAEERKKREQMWQWIQTHLGQDLKKLESVIDQRVRAHQPVSSSQSTHTASVSSASPWSAPSAHSAPAHSSTNHSSTSSTPVKSSGAPRQRQQQRISRSQTSEEEDDSSESPRGGGSSTGAGAGAGGLANNPFMQHSAANRSSGGGSSNRFVQPASSGGSNRFVASHASSHSASNTSGNSSAAPSSSSSSSSSHSSSVASFAEVRDWLTKQSMERYADNFESHGYTSLSKVAKMTKTDLSSAGIKLLGHKKALLLAIEELQQSTPTTKALSTSGSSHSRAVPAAVDEDAVFWGDSPKVAASPQPRRSRPKTTYASSGSMSLSSSIDDAVHQVKNDHIATNWALFQYEPKSNSVGVDCQGEGGYDEFLSNLSEAKVQWGLLRVEDGDRESRRVKFVFVTWCGPSTNGIVKARSNTHKRDVVRSVGQFHIEIFAEDLGDLDMSLIQKQLKKAGGADYDTGSNKLGYTSQAKSIREKALANLRRTDDPNSASAFVFEKHALPSSTPCDLSGRKFVAPPSEAQANIDLAGGLDVSKWQ